MARTRKKTNADGQELIKRGVVYRRATIIPEQEQTLQQLLTDALGQKQEVEDRTQPVPATEGEFRAIGDYENRKGFLCGFLSPFSPGKPQPSVITGQKVKRLKLSRVPPPRLRADGQQEHFSPGTVFFVISNNHVVISQTLTIRSAALENHFSWLLRERTSTLEATASVLLSDEVRKATKERIRQTHVKSIRLGQDLMGEVAPPKSAAKAIPEPVEKGRKRYRPGGPAAKFLQSLLADEADKLGWSEVFDTNLEVWIEIRYPKYNRTKDVDTVKMMDTLGIALRDIEGDEVALQLQDGSKVQGKDLKISHTIEVTDGTNLAANVWSEMIEWLNHLTSNAIVLVD